MKNFSMAGCLVYSPGGHSVTFKNIAFIGIALLIAAIILSFTACNINPDPDFESIDIEMVRIPSGTFTMGSPDTELDRNQLREGPLREVTLTGFYMSKYPVTQAQYRAVMGRNPSFFQGNLEVLTGVNTDNLPVERVSWYDAVEFCNMLSELEGLTPAYIIDKNTRDTNNLNTNVNDPKWTVTLRPGSNGYRLPTEAQWEYACRAGTTTPFYTGATINTDQANFNGTRYTPDSPVGVNRRRTTEVGSFPANAWGLYDMHGNVYEWCWDFINNDTAADEYINFYDVAVDPIVDPTGLVSGDRRVERGGSWNHPASRIRSAWRERAQPQREDNDLGFRVVLPDNNPTVGINIEMIEVLAGPPRFIMGSPADAGQAWERPEREVILSCFFMSKYQITQAQFQTVMGFNPSHFQGSNIPAGVNGNRLPVDQVSWYMAVEFCNMLSLLEGLTPAYNIDKNTPDSNNTNSADTIKWTVTLVDGADGYRLPTEAEWEYACRTGPNNRPNPPERYPPFSTGETITNEQANFNNNNNRTTEVGSYPPNAWGLHDMHGNVWEWCWDFINSGQGDDYYSQSNNTSNPMGRVSGDRRAARGGAWNSSMDAQGSSLRSAYRQRSHAHREDYNDLGFRIVRPKYPDGIPSN